MANEIHFTGSLTAFKPSIMSSAIGRSIVDFIATMTNNAYVQGEVSVATTATVFPLGSVGAPHWAFFVNKDPTNFVTIRNGASGADLVQLNPGEPAFFPMPPTCNPYGVANTAACIVEYLILAL